MCIRDRIEGFFDICKARGLTGSQGVLIPRANVQHLMLRKEVIQTCAANRFGVYPIATINEGIALLTGLAAGERGVDGTHPTRQRQSKSRGSLAVLRKYLAGFQHGKGACIKGRFMMGTIDQSFKRIVLGLQSTSANRTVQLAVELAGLLHLELLGLYLDDIGLRDLANFPFAREFRLLEGWQPINLDRLSRDLELGASMTE